MSAPDRPADSAPRPATAPERPSPDTRDRTAAHAQPVAPVEDAEEGARTPDEYTEPPGSHRRASDGAALDVGG